MVVDKRFNFNFSLNKQNLKIRLWPTNTKKLFEKVAFVIGFVNEET